MSLVTKKKYDEIKNQYMYVISFEKDTGRRAFTHRTSFVEAVEISREQAKIGRTTLILTAEEEDKVMSYELNSGYPTRITYEETLEMIDISN